LNGVRRPDKRDDLDIGDERRNQEGNPENYASTRLPFHSHPCLDRKKPKLNLEDDLLSFVVTFVAEAFGELLNTGWIIARRAVLSNYQ
jgi:hypothetical protein